MELVAVGVAAFWLLVLPLFGRWVAKQKGRSAGEGLLLGLLFGPFGVHIEALLPNKGAIARAQASASSNSAVSAPIAPSSRPVYRTKAEIKADDLDCTDGLTPKGTRKYQRPATGETFYVRG